MTRRRRPGRAGVAPVPAAVAEPAADGVTDGATDGAADRATGGPAERAGSRSAAGYGFSRHSPMHLSARAALWREGAVLALYVSIVLLAELMALPEDYASSTHQGPSLLGVVWGTAIGLAVAHWFAFQVAAVWFGGGRAVRADLHRAAAQIGGAALAALATTVPILLAGPTARVEVAAIAPLLIIGASGYGMARATGRSVYWSAGAGLLVLALGLGTAVLKAALSGH